MRGLFLPVPARLRLPFLLSLGLGLTACQSPSAKGKPAAVNPAPSSAPAAAAPAPAKRPATQTVARGSLKRTLALDAVVEAVEMRPMRLEPKAWMDLTVVEAVPHGTRVKSGDVVLRLDADKLREQVEDLELDRPMSTTAMELASAELANLTEATPARLEAARRGRRVANEDEAYFESTGRERREKGAEFGLKSAEQRLANANEELKQLEKMYKADDLTEETEEIVLKRQKFEVEAAQLGLENARLSTERELKTMIPREAENLKTQKRDQDLAQTYAEESLPRTLLRKKLEFEKLGRDQKKAQKRLADMKGDLEKFTVRAPIDGIVMHGACEGGRWTTGAGVTKKLVPGGKLMPYEVFMTVVGPDNLQLRAVVPEGELAKARPGLTGEAVPTAVPDRKLALKLERVDRVPLVTGGFDAVMSLTVAGPADVLPGMNCKVTLNDTYRNNVVLVPSEAVLAEGDRKQVYVAKGDTKPEKRTVRTGETDGKSVEIVEGLSEGEIIFLGKPE